MRPRDTVQYQFSSCVKEFWELKECQEWHQIYAYKWPQQLYNQSAKTRNKLFTTTFHFFQLSSGNWVWKWKLNHLPSKKLCSLFCVSMTNICLYWQRSSFTLVLVMLSLIQHQKRQLPSNKNHIGVMPSKLFLKVTVWRRLMFPQEICKNNNIEHTRPATVFS